VTRSVGLGRWKPFVGLVAVSSCLGACGENSKTGSDLLRLYLSKVPQSAVRYSPSLGKEASASIEIRAEFAADGCVVGALKFTVPSNMRAGRNNPEDPGCDAVVGGPGSYGGAFAGADCNLISIVRHSQPLRLEVSTVCTK
jgi:hypothetical protein